MSLTSYRAAPPRGCVEGTKPGFVLVLTGRSLASAWCFPDLAGLAATYSPASIGAVPLALRVFTAEFGMGSGVWPLAMATRPARTGLQGSGARDHRGSEAPGVCASVFAGAR